MARLLFHFQTRLPGVTGQEVFLKFTGTTKAREFKFLQNKYQSKYLLMENPVHRTINRCFLNSNTGCEVDLQQKNGLLRIMQWNILADG